VDSSCSMRRGATWPAPHDTSKQRWRSQRGRRWRQWPLGFVSRLSDEYLHVAVEAAIPADHVIELVEPDFLRAAFGMHAKRAAVGVHVAGKRAECRADEAPVIHLLIRIGAAVVEPQVHLSGH
jgi:hypothetical protein